MYNLEKKNVTEVFITSEILNTARIELSYS